MMNVPKVAESSGKTVILGLAALCVACNLSCTVCGEEKVPGRGRVVSEIYKVKDFTGVNLATFGNLHIETGDRESLRIVAQENLQRYFEVDVSGKMLKINTRRRVSLRPSKPVDFYLTVKNLDTIHVSGSGDVFAPNLEADEFSVKVSGSGDVEIGTVEADEIVVKVSGSGNVDLAGAEAEKQRVFVSGSGEVQIRDLDGRSLDVRITGSGNVAVSDGHVERQSVVVSGSGDYGARRMECSEAEVQISGCGSATVHVEDHLEAQVSGSGDVRFAGRPRVSRRVTGSGRVREI